MRNLKLPSWADDMPDHTLINAKDLAAANDFHVNHILRLQRDGEIPPPTTTRTELRRQDYRTTRPKISLRHSGRDLYWALGDLRKMAEQNKFRIGNCPVCNKDSWGRSSPDQPKQKQRRHFYIVKGWSTPVCGHCVRKIKRNNNGLCESF